MLRPALGGSLAHHARGGPFHLGNLLPEPLNVGLHILKLAVRGLCKQLGLGNRALSVRRPRIRRCICDSLDDPVQKGGGVFAVLDITQLSAG